MGEIADYLVERMLSQGLNPLARKARRDPVCSECGSRDVKWALMDGGYRLVDNKRGPHNRNVIHVCHYDDDFEEQP